MRVSRPRMQARWWKDAKPTRVKDKKLDDALGAFERVQKEHERKRTPESAAALKKAAEAVSSAASKTTAQCDRKTDKEVIDALKDLIKLAQREEKSIEVAEEPGEEAAGKNTSPARVRALMKKLRDERMGFAFGLSSRTAMWFALHRKMKGNPLMNQLKKETAAKRATFGSAMIEDKVLVLEQEGPKIAGLDKLVREYLKQNKPMPVTQVALAGASDAVDDAVADALNEDDSDGGAGAEETRAEPAQDAARRIKISATVGAGGRNVAEDVSAVQAALNRHGATLEVDGLSGPKTVGAIRDFQRGLGFRSPDGRVDPGGTTEAALNGQKVDVPGGGGGSGGAPPSGTGGRGSGPGGGIAGGIAGGAGAAGGRRAARRGFEDDVERAKDAFEEAFDDAADYARKIAKTLNRERKKVTDKVEQRVEELAEMERQAREREAREAERTAREMRERIERAYDEGRERVGEFAERTEELVRDGTEAAKDAFDEATRLAGKGLKTAGDAADEAYDWLKDQWDKT